MTRPRIGLALGSGSARGWAHIGVLHALDEAGIEPDIVCGTSIGAAVGGAYVAGQLDTLESWARSISRFDIVGLMDVTLRRGGFIKGVRIFDELRGMRTNARIEDLPKPFAAVATDFTTGHEIWLQTGPLLDAVRASTSLPGLFPPFRLGDRWLVDGGLVNPVPVSVCRALGAEVVFAVNLNGDLTTRINVPHVTPRRERARPAARGDLPAKLSARLKAQFRGTTSFLGTQLRGPRADTPGMLEILAGAIYIMQDRITRSRMAGDPPDVMFTPRLGSIRLLDFHRSAEVIAAGRACVQPLLPEIKRSLAMLGQA